MEEISIEIDLIEAYKYIKQSLITFQIIFLKQKIYTNHKMIKSSILYCTTDIGNIFFKYRTAKILNIIRKTVKLAKI